MTDQGGTSEPKPREADDMAESGRGLTTIAALASRWDWTGDANGRTVIAVFDGTDRGQANAMLSRLRGRPDDYLLTPREAAMAIGVSTTTMTRWTKAARLAYTLTPNGHRRYRWADIREILEADE